MLEASLSQRGLRYEGVEAGLPGLVAPPAIPAMPPLDVAHLLADQPSELQQEMPPDR